MSRKLKVVKPAPTQTAQASPSAAEKPLPPPLRDIVHPYFFGSHAPLGGFQVLRESKGPKIGGLQRYRNDIVRDFVSSGPLAEAMSRGLNIGVVAE